MHGFETTRLAAQDPNIERGAVLDCDLFPEVVKSGAAAGFASLDCDRPEHGGDTSSVCRNALEKEVGQGPNEKQAQEENNVTPSSLEKAIGVQQVDNTPLAEPVKKVLITGSRETEDTPKGKGSRAAGKFFEEFSMALEAIIQGSMGKKERKGKESGLGSEKSGAAHASVKGVSERNSKGEVREFKNSMDWVRVVEEFMKKDKLLDQKVKEAMKEINEYLWTVYDKEKEEYTEEGRNRAMKAATIFLVKVKHCPSWIYERRSGKCAAAGVGCSRFE
nr:hypothetical protein Iba_chr04fCG7820 [Ipomoea batatas]